MRVPLSTCLLLLGLVVLVGVGVWMSRPEREGMDPAGEAAADPPAADAAPAPDGEPASGAPGPSRPQLDVPANAEEYATVPENPKTIKAAGDMMSGGTPAAGNNVDSVLLGSSVVPGSQSGATVQAGGSAALGGFNVCLAVTPLDEASKAQSQAMSGPAATPGASKGDVKDLKEALSDKVDQRAAEDAANAGVTGATQRAIDAAGGTSTPLPTLTPSTDNACSFGMYKNPLNNNLCEACRGKYTSAMKEECVTSETEYWAVGLIEKSEGEGCNLLPSNVLLAPVNLVKLGRTDPSNVEQTAARAINDAYTNYESISFADDAWATQANPPGLEAPWESQWDPSYTNVKTTLPQPMLEASCNAVEYRKRVWVIIPIQEDTVLEGDGKAYPKLATTGDSWTWVGGSLHLISTDETEGESWASARQRLIAAGPK